MEMAAELLAVSDEAELDQLLGGWFKKAGRAFGKFINPLRAILADFWSVARVGVGSTLGLMGVVSLPRSADVMMSRLREAP